MPRYTLEYVDGTLEIVDARSVAEACATRAGLRKIMLTPDDAESDDATAATEAPGVTANADQNEKEFGDKGDFGPDDSDLDGDEQDLDGVE